MKQYVVDAFSEKVFGGNPAAICVMDSWISDELMMNITRENNLSETAFAVKEGDKYKLRWFTPGGEIDLCGHATLGCAYIIMNYIDIDTQKVTFDTISGDLVVIRKDDLYEMDFPAYDLKPVTITKEIDGLLLQVSAPGNEVDCVSRSFAPKLNVIEDPVCGSGHCHIAPYWINKLNKSEIIAYQASSRGGMLYCSMEGNRVKLRGKAHCTQ